MELYFIRHGESVGNVTPGKDMPDCPLTNKGKEQAKLVGERLKEIKFTHILSSPLIRALETAQPLAQHLKQPIEVIPNAYEMRRPESCKGAVLSDLMEQFPEAQFPEDFETDGWHYEGNETPEMVMKRAKSIIDKLQQYPQDATIVLFAHGTLHQYLIRALLGIEDLLQIRTSQSNTSINWFTVTDKFIRINAIGDVHHLRELMKV